MLILKRIITILFSFFVVVLIVDPADKIFHLKIPLFLSIMFCWILYKVKTKIKYKIDSIRIIIALITITLFGILTAFFQNNDVDYSFSIGFLKSICILFVLIVVIDLGLEADVTLNKYSILIPGLTIPFYFVSIYNPIIFSVIYDYVVIDKQVGLFAERNFYGYNLLSVYYKTSPILVFPLSFFCDKLIYGKNKFASLFLVITFFSSLIISGTRANIVSATIILLYYFYLYLNKKKNALYSIFAIASFFFLFITFLLSLSFGEKEASSEIKAGHFNSFLDNTASNPQYLIWGQGLGSKYYSQGVGEFTTQTELTYFDLVRFFGFPLAILFMICIVYPLIYLIINKKITDRNRYCIIAFLTYLFISGTNPLLISSTGMLIIVVMYSLLDEKSSKSRTAL